MFLTEFFGKNLDIKSPSDQDHNDQEIANEIFQYILEHDRLHKEYFHPLAKKISRQQQNKKENKSQLVKEFMPMVEKGCKEFYHKNKMTGKLGKVFPLEMREELCDRLYDHYCDDIKGDKYKLMEGGNLSLDNPDDPTKPHQADEINLKVHNRTYMVGLLNKMLHDISAVFQSKYKKSLWSANLLQSREFLSGSSLHFFNTNGISDEEFAKHKPKVGDIDTQVDDKLEPEVEEFLTAMTGKQIGDTKFLGFSRGTSQFNGLFQFQDPPMKIQVDFEFGGYGEKTGTPDDWFKFSHSSDWNDITSGIKGVFHKYLYRALASGGSAQQAYVAKMQGRGKARGVVINPEPAEVNMLSFAVASKQGGGMSRKHVPYTDPETGESSRNGLPIVIEVDPKDRTYIQNLSEQFEMIFGRKPQGNDSQLQQSFIGTLDLINKYLDPDRKPAIIQDFLDICFEIGGQMITKDDPVRDAQTKFAAIDVMLEKLGMGNMRDQAVAQAKAYEEDYHELEAFKVANPHEKQPRAAMKKAKAAAAAAQGLTEAEDKPQPAVKAQLRKGMPHLRDLKPTDFLDLVDELQDSGGRFVLQNIPLNVKIDGFGGRFGKDAQGKPFMGTSRTKPKYKAGFLDYHKQKGTTDPEVLGRAANFDKLFNEMMTAIKMVDSALGPDFLVDRQVTCEVLFLPFATKTESGGLKFVGIEYDQIPQGVDLVLVPFRIVEGGSGEEIADGDAAVQQIAELGQSDNVMFMSNRLVQKSGLDVTEIVNVLDNIDELKDIVNGTAGRRDRASADLRRQVEEKLKPVQIALEKAIDEDPNIIGKDKLGTEYEGIVINSRLGPIKVTSQKQKDLIANKNAARASARTDRGRENANKTAVVAIGSFIGHRGHQELWNYTVDKAKKLNGDPYLFIGNAEGKADPIPPSVKVETWHKLYPRYARNISTVNHEGGSLIQKIKHELINPLPGKPPRYDNVVIMVGEDRVNLNMPQALMKAVNKFPGYENVKVSLDVTPRGQGVSGTALRNAIKTKTPEEAFEEWNQAFNGGDFGAQQLPPDWIEHLMNISAKGMGIAPKAAEPAKVAQPEKTKEPVAERILTALINHKTSVAEDEEHQLRQRLIRAIARATGYGVAELNLLSTAELRDLVKEKSHHKHRDTEESYWGGPSPAQKRFNRALERERKKSEPDRERFQRELDRIMPPPAKKDDPEEKLNEFDHARHVKLLNTHMKKLGYKNIGAGFWDKHKGPGQNVWEQGVAEGSNNNNITAQKIFFARSDKTPKGWSYDHVGFITQDGRQIQMSGHKGNDVYVTNNVTDDPEFPEQNIKIVSLSKPVSVPTTNSVGAENCGTFVANVLQANGIKGIDTQKIYSVFKQPPKQGVEEGRKKKNKKTSKYFGGYFFPGYGYYGSGESGDGGGGESMAEAKLNEFDHARHVKLLNTHMKKLGYKNIGAGTDAQVFAKETGPVKKILMPKSGDISTAENSFLAFYNYCQANARNPHLPKFHQIQDNIELDGERFRQITMERLEEVDPEYEDMLVSMTDGIEDGTPLDPQYQPYIKFYQTLKSVMLTGRKLGFENDIITFQSCNIMQRGNTLVIMDPWIGGGSMEDIRTVPNRIPVDESVENIMAALIDRIIVNEAIQNRQQ
jgi:hypothetical protein